MGLFQKLFARNKQASATTTTATETMEVEVNKGKADVAPVKATTTRCAATTKAGTPCKRNAAGTGTFCGTHSN